MVNSRGELVIAIILGVSLPGTVASIGVADDVVSVGTDTDTDTNTSVDEVTCEPACRGAFICREGACVSPCQPLCAPGERCSKAGTCIPVVPPSEPSPPSTGADDVDQASVGDAIALALIREEAERKKEKVRQDKHRRFAVLINPWALAILPALYGALS